MTRCTYPGCSRPIHARGLCGTHYQRAWQTKTLPPLRDEGEYRVWFWICNHCGVRSFATFATAAEAERYCEHHEAECRQRDEAAS